MLITVENGCADLILIKDMVYGHTWGLVENVYVSKSHRRKGVGTELMRKVEKEAKRLGCKYIKLTSRKPAGQKLYQKLGYEKGDSYYCQLE